MLIGLAAATVLIGVPSLILSGFGSSPERVPIEVNLVGPLGELPKAAAARLVRWVAEDKSFHGQFGVTVNVIPEGTFSVAAITPAQLPANIPVVPDPTDIDEPDGMNDGIDGFGDATATSEADYFADTTISFVNRDSITVVRKTDPEYPRVADDAGKEGRVSILVYVDEYGELARFPSDIAKNSRVKLLEFETDGYKQTMEYCVVVEQPQGWFFAKNLLKVLPTWRFLPEVHQGVPSGDFLVVTYHYCKGVNCSRLELQMVKK